MNWVDHVTSKIGEISPEVLPVAPLVGEKLALLFSRRLPADIARPLIMLLPKSYEYFYDHLEEQGDCSLGYPDFIEKTYHAIPWVVSERTATQVADAFLKSVLAQIPERLHWKIKAALPAELLNKMGVTIAEIRALREQRRAA